MIYTGYLPDNEVGVSWLFNNNQTSVCLIASAQTSVYPHMNMSISYTENSVQIYCSTQGSASPLYQMNYNAQPYYFLCFGGTTQ